MAIKLPIVPVHPHHRAVLEGFFHCGNSFIVSNILNPEKIVDHFPENGVISHRHDPRQLDVTGVPKFLLVREPFDNATSLVSRQGRMEPYSMEYPTDINAALQMWIDYHRACLSHRPFVVIPFGLVRDDYQAVRRMIESNSTIKMREDPTFASTNAFLGQKVTRTPNSKLMQEATALYADLVG